MNHHKNPNHQTSSNSSLKVMGFPDLYPNYGRDLAIKGYENSKMTVSMKKFPALVQF